jgi:plastocyanin
MKKLTGSKSRFLIVAVLLFSIITISDSCSKNSMANMYGTNNSGTSGGSGGPGTNEVWIQGMAFSPATITVTVGTTITWTNKDGVAHTVTSNTNIFNSGNIASNGTFTYTFATAGTYSYYCAIHPGMIANVVVN